MVPFQLVSGAHIKGHGMTTQEYKRKWGNPPTVSNNVLEKRGKSISKSKKGTMVGPDNPFYGKTHSVGVRGIISKANKGKVGPWANKRIPESARVKMSINHANVSGRLNPMFGRTTNQAKYHQYKGVSFRSGWEVKVAKYLDEVGVLWKYEEIRFDLLDCTYCPDFYLVEQDIFVEVKGVVTEGFLIRMSKMKELYPKVEVQIWDRKKLQSLGIDTN